MTGTGAQEIVFHALADPTRRAILARIATERIHVAELAEDFPMSRPAISKHLRILKNAGLLNMEQAGKKTFYRLNPQPLAEVDHWLATYRQLWQTSLDNLKRVAEDEG